MDDPVETKLSAARTRLILDRPFLGALVLRLPMIAADPQWCRTVATDARAFYYNRAYIEALDLDATQFVLAHEAMHCALSHFARRQHRVKHRWDVACDHAINPLLVEEGLRPPPGTLLLDEFKGMTAEEIYPCIKDETEEETIDQHVYDESGGHGSGGDNAPIEPPPPQRVPRNDGTRAAPDEHDRSAGGGAHPPDSPDAGPTAGGAPQPAPLKADERETLSVRWQQRLAGAAQQAMQAGKLGGSLARLVDHLLQPQLPWRMLLARYMTANAREDYSFARPSRREGAAILPRLRSTQLELVVVIDSSGSVQDDEMREFLAEVNAIKGQLPARITLLACDDRLAEDGPWVFESWEELRPPSALQGGGGTSFVPAFEWAARQDRQPDLLLYFTDGDGEFPPRAPAFPVIWLVKGKAPVPWGQRVQLN